MLQHLNHPSGLSCSSSSTGLRTIAKKSFEHHAPLHGHSLYHLWLCFQPKYVIQKSPAIIPFLGPHVSAAQTTSHRRISYLFPFASRSSSKMYALSPPYNLLRGPRGASTCRAVATPDPRVSDTPSVAPSPSRNKNAVEDPALRSTWAHRAWVAAGSATVLAALTNSATAAAESGSVVEPALAAVLGYVLADLGTGFYHFGIDNYGSASTPIFGPQIEAFQGHHRRPGTITRRQPANNLHALARALVFTVVPLELAIGHGSAAAHAFVGVCAGCVMLSQQFHAWAHGTKGRVPRWVEALQGAGVLISRDMHGAHHRAPYNCNYCIVSGVWNWVLDEYRVFEAVEMVLYFKFGVRPRSWGETAEEWKEEQEEEEMAIS